MAKGGRFPLLYWTSIGLLVLMLTFTGWYFYRTTLGSCDNLLGDRVTREYVQRLWQEGRITVLMRHTDRCREGDGQHCIDGLTVKGQADARAIGAGMKQLFSTDFDLYSSKVDRAIATASLAFGRPPKVVSWLREDCKEDLQRQLQAPRQGNQVMVTHSTCLGVLTDARGGIPRVLACAWPQDWVESVHD